MDGRGSLGFGGLPDFRPGKRLRGAAAAAAPHAAAAVAAAWMRCSAGFGLGPDSGSEVELEALRPALFKLLFAVGLLSVDLCVTELDSGSVARSDSACVCVKMAECRESWCVGGDVNVVGWLTQTQWPVTDSAVRL